MKMPSTDLPSAEGLGWRVDFGVVVVCCLVGAHFLRHVHERVRGGPEDDTDESRAPQA